jgi:hypothetical protein
MKKTDRQKPAEKTTAMVPLSSGSSERKSRGRRRDDASFPVAPTHQRLPNGYGDLLSEIKRRIGNERLRTVMAANSAMVMLYWDIGGLILERQEREGWGAMIIDRLSADLRKDYPDMSGLSPRNLKYMRAFAAAWPDRSIVQRVVAQIPWRSNLALLEKLIACSGRSLTMLWGVLIGLGGPRESEARPLSPPWPGGNWNNH